MRRLAIVILVPLALMAARCEDGDFTSAREPGNDSRPNSLPAQVASAQRPPHSQVFVPASSRKHGKVVMPVTFPDGTTAELRYRARLDLVRQGIRPYSSGSLAGRSGRDFAIYFGGAREFLEGRAPVATYVGRNDENVELWRARESGPEYYLVFRFGSWWVLVWDGGGGALMTEAERTTWARSLQGRETEDGFLVLEAERPLRLARFGDHAGPELMLGDGAGNDVVLITGLWCGDGGTREHPDRSSGFASWCLPKPSRSAIAVHVYARNRGFVDAVSEGLEIAKIRPAASRGAHAARNGDLQRWTRC
jgi:hypothetical protein